MTPRHIWRAFLVVYALCHPTIAFSKTKEFSHPEVEMAGRSYQQNFRDLMLALCVVKAFEGDREVEWDVGSSFAALRERTNYDVDVLKTQDELNQLVAAYLGRNYRSAHAEHELGKSPDYKFLKCLDMYHSKALVKLTQRLCPDPKKLLEPAGGAKNSGGGAKAP